MNTHGCKVEFFERVERFVSQMNRIDQDMIARLMQYEPDDWHEVTVFDDDDERYRDYLPMWGSMWSFNDNSDEWWLENRDGIAIMSQCGFRIYHNAEFGYFFGIDGAGYDFYEAHWIPLYKARFKGVLCEEASA